jgi:hypothetical protein
MLNIEKVKSMTKAAAYESGPEKKNIEISDYFRTDYLGLHMVKSGIAYALSFVIIAGIWFMGKTEDIMLMLTKTDYLESLIKMLAVLFVAGLVAYEILVYCYYSYKYRNAKKSVRGYHSHLKQIHKIYMEQEKTEEVEEITL